MEGGRASEIKTGTRSRTLSFHFNRYVLSGSVGGEFFACFPSNKEALHCGGFLCWINECLLVWQLPGSTAGTPRLWCEENLENMLETKSTIRSVFLSGKESRRERVFCWIVGKQDLGRTGRDRIFRSMIHLSAVHVPPNSTPLQTICSLL